MKIEFKISADTESDSYFDDEQQIKDMMNVNKYKRFLEEVERTLFRPILKHGSFPRSIQGKDLDFLHNIAEFKECFYELKEEVFNEE